MATTLLEAARRLGIKTEAQDKTAPTALTDEQLEEGKKGYEKFIEDQKNNMPWYGKVENAVGDVLSSIGIWAHTQMFGSVLNPWARKEEKNKELPYAISPEKPSADWSDEERNTFGYLYTQDANEAAKYAIRIYNKYNAEVQERLNKVSETTAKETPVLGSIASVALAPTSMVGMLGTARDYAISKKYGETVKSADYVSALNHQSTRGAIANQLNASGTLSDDLWAIGGKGWGDVYSLGMGIADSLFLGAGTMTGAGMLLNRATYFSRSATEGYNDAISRGLPPDTAGLYGVIIGAIECLTESTSDKLLANVGKDQAKGLLGEALRQAGQEGVEEFVSALVDALAQEGLFGENSDRQRLIKYYMSEFNMSHEEASNRALVDLAGEIVFAGLGGALAGGVSAGSVGGLKTAWNKSSVNPLNQTATKELGPIQDKLFESGKTIEDGTSRATIDKLSQKKDSGKELSGYDLRKLHSAVTEGQETDTKNNVKLAIAERLKDKGVKIEDIPALTKIILSKALGENLTKVQQIKLKNSEIATAVSNEMDATNMLSGNFDSQWAIDAGINKIRDVSGVIQTALAEANKEDVAEGSTTALNLSTEAREALRGKFTGLNSAYTPQSENTHIHTDEIKSTTLDAKQTAQIRAIERVANALGVDFYIYESEYSKKDGRKYVDKDGNVITDSGYYDPRDNSIHIDLHAGQNGEGTMLYTASHELVHWIKKSAADQFEALKDFVLGSLKKEGVQIETLIEKQINKAKENGRDMDRDGAIEEIVADACMTVLTTDAGIKAVTNLKTENKGLWNALKRFFTQFFNRIDKMYKGVKVDSEEGQYLADMHETAKKLRDLFVEGAQTAAKSSETKQTKAETAERKSSARTGIVDSNGNALTEQQQAYFKDSKVRDAEGNLLVVYHGSPSKFTMFDHRKLNTHGNAHGRGFYFTETKGLAESYSKEGGQLLEGYLDIKNPMSEERVTIKRSALVRLIKESCKEQAKSLVADEGYSSITEALPDTWVSNYVMTYGMSMDDVYREVADIIYDSSDNDVDIIAEMTNAGAGNEATLRLTRKILGYDGVIYTNEAYGGHEFVIFESNQFKNIDNKTPTTNPDIRYSARKGTGHLHIDKLTAKQYNYFGWARANDVLTTEEYTNFETEFSKAVTSKEYDSYKSSSGEYMIAVGALYGANEGVKRKIVFARGTIEEPIITRIVEIDAHNETELSEERGYIYAAERKGTRTKADGLLQVYTRFDYADFPEIQRNFRGGERNNNQLGVNRGAGSSGTQKVESRVRNSIAPIAQTFKDANGKNRKVRRYGSQYMVEDTKRKKRFFDTVEAAIEAENAYLESKKIKHSARKRITPEMDASYLDAVNRGDTETAQRLVDDNAIIWGAEQDETGKPLHLYHGTSMFGFTEINVEDASDDSISFFATNNPEIAQGYMPWYEDEKSDLYHEDVRRIGKPEDRKHRGLSVNSKPEDVIKAVSKEFPEYKNARVATDKEVLDYLNAYWLPEAISAAEKLRAMDIPLASNNVRQKIYDMCNAVTTAAHKNSFSAWKDVAARYKEFDKIDIPFDASDMRPHLFYSHILGGIQQVSNFARTIPLWNDGSITNTAYLIDKYNSLLGGEAIGIYDLYAKSGKRLIVQGRGSLWNDIQLGSIEAEYRKWLGSRISEEEKITASTRDIAEFAKQNGYRSVVFYDIYDSGAYGNRGVISDVYAFFYPQEDVKSADPVTYDDNGNVIPLSERFNSAQSDIRYSPRKKRTVTLSVGEEAKFRANYTRSKVFSKSNMYRIIEKFASKGELTAKTTEELADDMWISFNSATSVEERREFAHSTAQFVVSKLLQESKSQSKEAKAATEQLLYLKGGIRRIDFTPDEITEIRFKKDESGLKSIRARWGYHKSHTNAKVRPYPLDVFVTDVAREVPGMAYLADMNHVDAFFEIADMYDTLKAKVKDRWVSNYAETSNSDLDALQMEIEQTIFDAYITEGEQSKFGKFVSAKIDAYKERTEYWKAAYDNFKDRSRLENLVTYKAQKMEDLKKGTFLNATQYGNADAFKDSIEKLSSLKFRGAIRKPNAVRDIFKPILAWYTKDNPMLIDPKADEASPHKYSYEVAAMLEVIANGENGLSNDELAAIYEIMNYFTKFIETYNKVWRNGKWEDAIGIATTDIEIMQHVAKSNTMSALKRAANKYAELFSEPMFVARMSDGYQNGFFTQTMTELREAAKNAAIAEMEVREDYDKFLKEHPEYVEKASTEMVEFKGVQIPKMQLISLYMTYHRKHAQAGLIFNGFKFTTQPTKVGEVARTIAIPGATSPNADLSQAEFNALVKMEITLIRSKLNATDKEYIKMLEGLYNGQLRALKIQRDMDRLGFTNATLDYYYPIRRATIAKSIDTTVFEDVNRATNSSFNKNTVKGARQQLFIESADTLINKHIHEICNYAYMSGAIENYNVIYNLDVSGNPNNPVSVRTTIDATNLWTSSQKYFHKLVKDMQGIKSGDDTVINSALGWLRSGYVKFQLGLNLKTIASQASSIYAATNVLDYGSIVKGMGVDATGVDDYCAYAKLRHYDKSAIKAMTVTEKIGKKTEWVTAGIEAMDRLIITKLFGACQVQAEKNGAGKIGTEENKIAAGKLLEKVILDTQSNALATEKSSAMRSESEVAKMLTMFRADSMKVVTRVFESVGELRMLKANNASETEIKGAQVKVAKSVASLVMVSAFMATLAQLFRWIYNKEQDENRVLVDVAFDFAGNLLSGVPLLSDLWDYFIDGFEPSSMALDVVFTLAGGVNSITKDLFDAIFREDKPSRQKIMRDLRTVLYGACQFAGIPVRNVYNMVTGVIGNISSKAEYRIDDFFNENNYYSDLKEAIEKEDLAKVDLLFSLAYGKQFGNSVSDATVEELNRLAKLGKDYRVLPKTIPDKITRDGIEYELTDNQKQDILAQYEKVNAAIDKLITLSSYKSLSDEKKVERLKYYYDKYFDLAVTSALGLAKSNEQLMYLAVGFDTYAKFHFATKGIKSDKDKNGNTISGSKRKKTIQAIDKLKLPEEKRLILIASKGYALTENERSKLVRYINGLKLSATTKNALAELCGFEVKNGKIVNK